MNKSFIETYYWDEFDRDQFDEALERAVKRIVSEKPKEANKWIQDNADNIKSELESFLFEAVSRINKPKPKVEKPALSFTDKDGATIELWVCDSGQRCEVAQHHSMHFGGDNTASLVYVTKNRGAGIQADEHNIDKASTWEWIQKWMERGLAAAGYLKDNETVLQKMKEEQR